MQSISHFAEREHINKLIEPYVTTIVSIFLKQLEDIDDESFMKSFDSFVMTLGSKIAQYALEIAKHMIDCFKKKIKEELEANDEVEYNAAEYLRPLDKLLKISVDNPEQFFEIEKVLF